MSVFIARQDKDFVSVVLSSALGCCL